MSAWVQSRATAPANVLGAEALLSRKSEPSQTPDGPAVTYALTLETVAVSDALPLVTVTVNGCAASPGNIGLSDVVANVRSFTVPAVVEPVPVPEPLVVQNAKPAVARAPTEIAAPSATNTFLRVIRIWVHSLGSNWH